MSYCVNCGVELSDSEKHCPLCHTEVINPKKPWEEPSERPYSHHFDNLVKKVDRRYFATLATLLLMIPILITFLYDVFSDSGITWSAYVLGGLVLIFVFFVLPFFLKKRRGIVLLVLDCAAVLLYLLLIEIMSSGDWFAGVALPIVAFAGVLAAVIIVLFSRQKPTGLLLKTAYLLMACGLLVVWIEAVIYLNAADMTFAGWSFYVLVPCAVLGVAAIILEHRKNFKEQIKRRLFY